MVESATGKIVSEKTKVQSLLHNVWAHDLSNRLKMRRKSVAKELGLGDDWDVGNDSHSDGNDQYSQAELDNHANQCNPNNDAYHSSRG